MSGQALVRMPPMPLAAPGDEPHVVVIGAGFGGLVLAVSARFSQDHTHLTRWQKFQPHLAFNLGRIVGFAALEIYSPKMSEIRSLAVAPDFRGGGVGRRLVQQCVERAQERQVLEVMAITSNDEFFQRCGFDFTLPGEKKALFLQTRDL